MQVPTAHEVARMFLDKWVADDPELKDSSGCWLVREEGTNVGTWVYPTGTLDMDYLLSFCLQVTDQFEGGGHAQDHLFVWVEHTDVDVAWYSQSPGLDGPLDDQDGYRVFRRWIGWTECMHEYYVERLRKG